MRLVVFGDSKGKKDGVNKKVLEKLLKQIRGLKPKPDYIVHLGDITAGDDDMNKLRRMLLSFRDITSHMNVRGTIIPVFGNHEEGENAIDASSETVFREVFADSLLDLGPEAYNGTVYLRDIGNTRFIVLNSCHFCEEKQITGEQLKWLEGALSQIRDFKIVFVHIPPYPTGAHLGTSMDEYEELRDEFWSVLDRNRVDIVFSGHEHNYSRRLIDKSFSTEKCKFSNEIYQIISGGGGEKLRDKYKSSAGVVVPPIAKNHYLVVDISNNRLAVKAYDLKGRLLDELEIKK